MPNVLQGSSITKITNGDKSLKIESFDKGLQGFDKALMMPILANLTVCHIFVECFHMLVIFSEFRGPHNISSKYTQTFYRFQFTTCYMGWAFWGYGRSFLIPNFIGSMLANVHITNTYIVNQLLANVGPMRHVI